MELVNSLTIAALVSTGLLAGASLDQSIKQLPARYRIGVETYSRYSEAADLGNGVPFYGMLGLGSALLTIGAAIAAHVASSPSQPLDLAAWMAALHTFVTSQAAPLLHSQRTHHDDHEILKDIFDRFSRWQTARVIFQLATFLALVWATINISLSK